MLLHPDSLYCDVSMSCLCFRQRAWEREYGAGLQASRVFRGMEYGVGSNSGVLW